MEMLVDLPDALYHQAKQAAAHKGLSLEEFIAGAVELKLRTEQATISKKKVQLPLVRSQRPGSRQLTAERIAEILDQEDVSA